MNLQNKLLAHVGAAALFAVTALTATAASATPFSYTGPAASNIDTWYATNTSFTVADTGTISSLDLFVNIGMAYADDVTVRLIHNDTNVLIYQGHGDSWSSVINATFSDAATGSAPYNGSAYGTFKAVDLLSAFNGQDLSGLWTLQTQDFIVSGDGTPLLGWGISGTISATLAPTAVPEPMTLAVFGAGLVGLGALRRRKSA